VRTPASDRQTALRVFASKVSHTPHSIRVSFHVVGFAIGPVWLRSCVIVSVEPSNLADEVANAPDAIVGGFFATSGRVVIFPSATSYVPD
jgi:hypothetical protein